MRWFALARTAVMSEHSSRPQQQVVRRSVLAGDSLAALILSLITGRRSVSPKNRAAAMARRRRRRVERPAAPVLSFDVGATTCSPYFNYMYDRTELREEERWESNSS